MQDLLNELQDRSRVLDQALAAFGKRGRAYAEAERQYRVGLNKKIVEERNKGTPVTIISDICRGNEVIAELKFQRDVAETAYKAAMEAINVYKLNIKVLEEQIQREWNCK